MEKNQLISNKKLVSMESAESAPDAQRVDTIFRLDKPTNVWTDMPASSVDCRQRAAIGTMYLETVQRALGGDERRHYARTIDICVRHLTEFDAAKDVCNDLNIITNDGLRPVTILRAEILKRMRGRIVNEIVRDELAAESIVVNADGTTRVVVRRVVFIWDLPRLRGAGKGAFVVQDVFLRPEMLFLGEHSPGVSTDDLLRQTLYLVAYVIQYTSVHVIGSSAFTERFEQFAFNKNVTELVHLHSKEPAAHLSTE